MCTILNKSSGERAKKRKKLEKGQQRTKPESTKQIHIHVRMMQNCMYSIWATLYFEKIGEWISHMMMSGSRIKENIFIYFLQITNTLDLWDQTMQRHDM